MTENKIILIKQKYKKDIKFKSNFILVYTLYYNSSLQIK